MPVNRQEIIDEIKRNIRAFGGDFTDWCVGTAKDARGPFFHNHLVAELGDGLIYREAFTADAARAIQEHLVHDCGLTPAAEAEGSSALYDLEPGKIVFVYRKTSQAPHELPSDHPTFRKLAA